MFGVRINVSSQPHTPFSHSLQRFPFKTACVALHFVFWALSEVDSISATLSVLPEKNEERGLIDRTAAGNCVYSVRPEERGVRNERKEDMGGGEGQTFKRPSSLFFPFFFLFARLH